MRKIAVVFTIILFVISFTNSSLVSSATTEFKEWKTQYNVSPNKTWKVSFNNKLKPDTIKGDYIFVMDDSEAKITGIEISLSEDQKTILVRAPKEGYIPMEEYTLYILSEVKSKFGISMKNSFKMKFHIKDTSLVEYGVTTETLTLKRPNGRTIEAWGYNGKVPGEEIRVKEGQTLIVNLTNKLPEPTTMHWHGISVPNGMDGVPGVTQNEVKPNDSFVYEFQANSPGTYFYHSHKNSSAQVNKGLYGAVVVEEENPTYDKDIVIFFDQFGINGNIGDEIPNFKVKNGERLHFRFINVSPTTYEIYVNGTEYQVTHTDGKQINEPSYINDGFIPIGSGERYDVELVADSSKDIYIARALNGSINPSTKMLLEYENGFISPGTDPNEITYTQFNLFSYGQIKNLPIGNTYDVMYNITLGTTDDFHYTINDKVYPNDYEPITVSEGDLVKVAINNPTTDDHPMHLHGHHFYVISRNGESIKGSPIYKDTLNVRPGERYEIAFLADNPGIWMFHCHILPHAARGMVTKLVYRNFNSEF